MNDFWGFVGRTYERAMPDFWLRMNPKYQWAFGIALLICLWLATGLFRQGAHADTAATKTAETPTVRVARLVATPHEALIPVRGRTEALHQVDVRAEVDGVVSAIHFEKGDRVKAGQVLCELKVNDRGARATQAEAQMAQAQKELEVAKELYKEGFRSKTQMAQSQATYEAAKAGAATMNIQLANTKIKAPFAGIVDERYANLGDYLQVGNKCAMVVAPEPFLAVGTLSEDVVGQVHPGNKARVKLVTGEMVDGTVRFVAEHADPNTRTFRVEIELPNPKALLKSGVSADIGIVPSKMLPAHKISPGILVLEDSGVVGVRVVQKNIARFIPVKVISDGPDGMWIAGLPPTADVIVVGQEFVGNGEKVKAVFERAGKAS
ncbi:multidrug efflux system membrane fusion protein [Rhizomicrobium palustre]|uniref:Multidrug efflux system membrane fusion protein n=1 Tax=Rhizomicrobium palustre TaxID=189966 RepID=A0A846MW40_9PROT|nr:multidrug efflux system membrane fusion protein [Rhizomicrobium palustre]